MSTEGKSVGGILREAREAKGLRLEDVTRTTRIGKHHLQAIEDDDYTKLPNLAYARGFVRTYASFLGLPADDIVAKFDSQTAPSAPPVHEKRKPAVYDKVKSGASRKWVLPLVLLAIAGITAYIVGRGTEEEKVPVVEPQPAIVPPPVQQPTTSAAQVPGPPPVQQQAPTSATPVPTPPPAHPAPTPARPVAPAPEKKGVLLRISVSAETWLNITIDGNISKRYQLRPGDIIEWKGEKYFTLDVGNAGAVTAEFNGKKLKPFGPPGEGAHVVLKPEGQQ